MPVDNKAYRETGEISCYAIRRVNPFLGVLQVIETRSGRAMSSDGVMWNLAICDETDNPLKSDAAGDKAKQYRYGLWSELDGLVSRTLNASDEADHLKVLCEALILCIQARIDLLPFQLVDTHELWLFEKDECLPIALLASKTPDAIKPSPEPKYWASHPGAEGVPGQARFPASKALEDLVLNAASPNAHKHWVVRSENNSGYVEELDVELCAEKFPVFLLSEEWGNEKQLKLVTDYIEWISPSLLTLQHLDRKQRQRLEKNLHTQAISVEHHWHLYPGIIDEKLIKAARVQSQIEKSQSG